MKTSINRIIILCFILIPTALIVSCSKPPSAIVKPQPTEQQPQKPSKAELPRQRAEQAFSELRAETDETQPQKPEKTKSDIQDKTKPKESESSSVNSHVKSDFPTMLSPLTPQQKSEGWVDAAGEYHQGPNMTAEEAKRRALEEAERNAIGTFGVAITAQTLQLKSETQNDLHESFLKLSQATVYGKIIDREEPVWEHETLQFPGELIIRHRVTLRAKVAKEVGERDPSFQFALKLNHGKVTFLEGEEMILNLTPTKDCYVTVFNVLSDGTVLVLFPPKGHTQRLSRAGKIMSIPSEAERSQGVHFRVGLLPGKTQDTEYVWVVATKDDIPFLPKEAKEFSPDIPALKGKVVLPTYQSALEEINRWLVSIPLNQRAVDMEQYEIRKR